MPRCSIVLPTTSDRAALATLAIASALRQTEQSFELLIVGDGLSASSVEQLRALVARDERLRLFTFPKHPSRGETYRHEVLAFAQGENVAYLLDRDLWLPDHLAVLGAALKRLDFAHTGMLVVEPDGQLHLGISSRLELARNRDALRAQRYCPIGMSSVGHRLASYRALPFGWRETPHRLKTDQYMWGQFLDQPWIRAGSVAQPTLFYFQRNGHPGWPTAQRLTELAHYAEQVLGPDGGAGLRASVVAAQMRPKARALRALRSWIRWRPALRSRLALLRGWFR